MKVRNLINTAVLTTGLVGAVVANAATSNPLQPTHFWGKVNVEIRTSSAAKVVAPTNPLQPGYFAAKAGASTFIATATSVKRYVDTSNPLHPSFKRI